MTLKELLDIAKTELRELTTLQNPDFRLEQVEYKKDEGVWDIVVSYLVDNTNKRINPTVNPLGTLTFEFQFHRIYKRLTINKNKEIEGFYLYNHNE